MLEIGWRVVGVGKHHLPMVGIIVVAVRQALLSQLHHSSRVAEPVEMTVNVSRKLQVESSSSIAKEVRALFFPLIEELPLDRRNSSTTS